MERCSANASRSSVKRNPFPCPCRYHACMNDLAHGVLVPPAARTSAAVTGAQAMLDTLVALGSDAFQECDALGLSRPVTKWNVQIRDRALVCALTRKAFEIARSGRPGPVLIDFPKDVQLAAGPIDSGESVAAKRNGCVSAP